MHTLIPKLNDTNTESRNEKIQKFIETCNNTTAENGIISYAVPAESGNIQSLMFYPSVDNLSPIYLNLIEDVPPVMADFKSDLIMNMQPRLQNYEVIMNNDGNLEIGYYLDGVKTKKHVIWRQYKSNISDSDKAKVSTVEDINNITEPIVLA